VSAQTGGGDRRSPPLLKSDWPITPEFASPARCPQNSQPIFINVPQYRHNKIPYNESINAVSVASCCLQDPSSSLSLTCYWSSKPTVRVRDTARSSNLLQTHKTLWQVTIQFSSYHNIKNAGKKNSTDYSPWQLGHDKLTNFYLNIWKRQKANISKVYSVTA
jgi:hypothetical protein